MNNSQRAQGVVLNGLTEAWGEFTDQHEPHVLPDYTIKLHHLPVSLILLLHPDDAGRFVHFLAADHMSKLRSHGPLLRVALMRQKPEVASRVRSGSTSAWNPPANPGKRIKFRAKAPYSEIDLYQTRLPPSAAGWRRSSNGTLGHLAFSVMQNQSVCDGEVGVRFPPYHGPLKLLGN
jgi:hypothetical protein